MGCYKLINLFSQICLNKNISDIDWWTGETPTARCFQQVKVCSGLEDVFLICICTSESEKMMVLLTSAEIKGGQI
jgi:hypothetical protein